MLKPLLTKSEIKKSNNLELLNQDGWLEWKIQSTCKTIFEKWLMEKKLEGLFVQIDNGGRMGIGQRNKKKLEGTVSGFPDVMLLVEGGKQVFVEFKKVDGKIDAKQLIMEQKLYALGFKSYMINNTLYFRRILEEIND